MVVDVTRHHCVQDLINVHRVGKELSFAPSKNWGTPNSLVCTSVLLDSLERKLFGITDPNSPNVLSSSSKFTVKALRLKTYDRWHNSKDRPLPHYKCDY